MRALLLVLLLTPFASAEDWVITDRVTCVKSIPTNYGFRWIYSNGAVIDEEYSDYVKRRSISPLTCSTGFCKKVSDGPVAPASGCKCGCNANSCNCAHSPNVETEIEALQKLGSPPSNSCQNCRRRVFRGFTTRTFQY
mgnify:CR=1 FL=1